MSISTNPDLQSEPGGLDTVDQPECDTTPALGGGVTPMAADSTLGVFNSAVTTASGSELHAVPTSLPTGSSLTQGAAHPGAPFTDSTSDIDHAREEIVVDTPTLMDREAPRPTHRGDLADELRSYLEETLASPGASKLARRPTTLWVSKGAYSAFAACEAFAVHRRSEAFSWSEPAVLGTVADRAIAYVLGTTTTPAAAAEQAITTLEAGHDDLASYLSGLGPSSRDLLALEVADLLQGLLEVWPAFSKKIYDHQLRLRVRLAGGAVVLSGVPDVVLGKLREPSGESRALVMDWKSGKIRAEHRVEQRFYALLVTLQAKRPPWRVATYYLAEQVALIDDVDEPLLWETATQVAAVIGRMAAIDAGDAPRRRRGPQCHWCPLRATCPIFLASTTETAPATSPGWP